MFQIDIRSDKPIYEQIIDNIKELSLRGNLREGDKLPSVRQLASMLTVNPNTVSKAYQELERQRLIETIRGRGTFMCDLTDINVSHERVDSVLEKLKDNCVELIVLGFEKEDIVREVEKIYEKVKEEGQDDRS